MESIALIGFGSFEVRERAARTGRNPKTCEMLKIAVSRVPAFKPGAALKAGVSGAEKNRTGALIPRLRRDQFLRQPHNVTMRHTRF